MSSNYSCMASYIIMPCINSSSPQKERSFGCKSPMDAIKEPSAVRMHHAPPRLHWVEPILWRGNNGVQKESGERRGKNGDIDIIIPDTIISNCGWWCRLSLIIYPPLMNRNLSQGCESSTKESVSQPALQLGVAIWFGQWIWVEVMCVNFLLCS